MKKIMPIINVLGDIARTYQLKRVSRSAAEFAYYLTLSIFPLLICAVAILSSFDLSLDSFLGDAWTGDIVDAVERYMEQLEDFSTQLLVAAIIIIATSSSAAFRAVAKIMTDIQGRPRYKGPLNVLVSFFFSLLLLFTIYISVFIIATGGWLMDTVEDLTGIDNLAMVWQWLRFVILFVVVVVVIHLMYLLTAPREPRYNRLIGAVLATVAIVAGSMIFSLFMGASVRYPLVYGSLASFMLLMLWCFLCGNILILGNVINFALYKHRRNVHRFDTKEAIDHG